MTLGPGSLVLCWGTMKRGTPLVDICRAARAGGYDGISFSGSVYRDASSSGLNYGEMKMVLSDHGIEVADLDAVWDWVPGALESVPDPIPRDSILLGSEPLFYEIAEKIGARSVNALAFMSKRQSELDHDAYAEAFAGLCDRAAEHGLVVHLEFVPWGQIGTLAAAWDVVQIAGRANSGIALDTWHFYRGDPDIELLRSLPSTAIRSVQISDAPAIAERNLLDETSHRRLLPGRGDLDLVSVLRALGDIKADTPIGVEVFSDVLRELDPLEVGRLTGDAVRQVVSESLL